MDIQQLNKKAWDNIGESTASPYINHEKYKEMFELFCSKLPNNARLLDFGCGPGIPFTRALVDKGFIVTAIDISDTMIRAVKKNVPEANSIRVSMTDIKFVNEFEGIFSGYSMLCLDPDSFRIAAIKAVNALRRRGLLFLALNEPPPKGHDDKENITIIMGQEMYSRPYTLEEVRDVFENIGMSIIKIARETVSSEAYGDEHTLIVLMRKE
ncbi:MAG: class I SAM-dependent methyltransferase [Candidatus Woesearchaeota archaeon]